eukprot:scaffold59477_cov34-Prasinocladus_malaysianus.AAC.2
MDSVYCSQSSLALITILASEATCVNHLSSVMLSMRFILMPVPAQSRRHLFTRSDISRFPKGKRRPRFFHPTFNLFGTDLPSMAEQPGQLQPCRYTDVHPWGQRVGWSPPEYL